jgi:hypothetical protein
MLRKDLMLSASLGLAVVSTAPARAHKAASRLVRLGGDGFLDPFVVVSRNERSSKLQTLPTNRSR